jgi:hypothetical protein
LFGYGINQEFRCEYHNFGRCYRQIDKGKSAALVFSPLSITGAGIVKARKDAMPDLDQETTGANEQLVVPRQLDLQVVIVAKAV